MKFGSLKSINPFAKAELNEEIKQGFTRLFSEELPRIIAQPSVKEYYEKDIQYPSGHIAKMGDFKDRGLQDPFRNFVAQLYALMFQQDSRFDLESNAYPHGGLQFDRLQDPNEKESREIQKAFETAFADRSFRKNCPRISFLYPERIQEIWSQPYVGYE